VIRELPRAMDEQEKYIMTAFLDRQAGNQEGNLRQYALGYSDVEFRRLELQGALFHDLTDDVMRRAGIKPGMRVLDIGCGVGDVSILVGELVGPGGAVVGLDRSREAIDVARRRARAAGQHWVSFDVTELDEFSTKQRFDAIVGRLVLAYLPDPAGLLRRFTNYLCADGIFVFQEMASPLVRSVPSGPVFEQCCRWILDTFELAGFELDMGGKLFAAFTAAGLPEPQMLAAGRVGGGLESPIYNYLTGVLRSLLPMAEWFAVATAAEVDVDTLADRLRKEAVARNSCIMLPPLVGAWTRRTGSTNSPSII
jgi:SAM-dependent methyltransferase